MLSKLYASSIFNSWISQAVRIVFSLIAVPVVLTKLSIEETNVWFLFATVVAISQAVQFGFNITFVRFLSYSYSGVSVKEFNGIKQKFTASQSTEANMEEFSDLFSVLKKVFLILTLLYFLIIITFGTWAVYKPISLIEDTNSGWITWALVVFSSALTLYYSVYQIYLVGINQVARVQRISALSSILGIGLFLGVTFFDPTLFNIVAVYQVIEILNTLGLIYIAYNVNSGFLKKLVKRNFNKNIFRMVWDSAWKSGITTIIANIVRHISGIIVAQLFTPASSASFLLTKRLFEVLDTFTASTFQAKIPEIASFRGKADFNNLIPLLRKVLYISYFVFLSGYVIIAFFGQDVLNLIKGNAELGSAELIILFSFAHLLSRWTGFNLAISNQSNNVIEHINAMVIFLFYFAFIYFFYKHLGLLVFPSAIIVSVVATVPLIIIKTYGTINTTFIQFEKRLFLPVFVLLIMINIFYYLSNT